MDVVYFDPMQGRYGIHTSNGLLAGARLKAKGHVSARSAAEQMHSLHNNSAGKAPKNAASCPRRSMEPLNPVCSQPWNL